METSHHDTLSTAILETVSLPLLSLDADLRVVTANAAFLKHFRVSQAETIGRLIYDLGNGQWDIPELRRLLSEILPQETTVSDYRVEHDFEQIGHRSMLLNARRIVRPDGADLVLLAIADETEREALRAELVGRIELADKLIDSVREGLLILDPDLRVQSASISFYDTFRVDRSETEGRLIYELGNGQWDIPELRQVLQEVLPRQQSFDDFEVTHKFEDIGERVMVLNGRRLDHQDLILLAIRDITEKRESATRLEEVATAAHVGVIEADLKAGTLYWSPELREIVGVSQDAPTSLPEDVPDFIHPDDHACVAAMIRNLFDPEGEGAVAHEHRIVRPDGEVRWVRLHAKCEFEWDGHEWQPRRMRGILLDITKNKAAEERLREGEERQTFLLKLSDAIRAAKPEDILSRAARMLCEHMGADRVSYAEDLGDDVHVALTSNYTNGVPSIVGRYRYEDFGRDLVRKLRAGESVVRSDIANDPTLSEAEKEAHRKLQLGATLNIPLVAEGRLKLILAVHYHEAHEFTEAEIALAEEVGERTWAVVERARAEAALRESEAKYRKIFDSIDEGFYLAEAIYDTTGACVDLHYRDENPAAVQMTGASFKGQLLSEMGDYEPYWLEIFGDVARTGKAQRLQRFAKPVNAWFDFYVFKPTNNPPNAVAVVFRDITERKQTEEHQNMLMAELDHRVKNILAVVQSITNQTLGRGQPTADAGKTLVGRINALASSHALLAISRWEGARFKDIVESAVAPYRNGQADRIVAQGSDLKVAPKAAQTLNLAIHELVTNAAKYGALSREEGHITAEWHLTANREDPHLVFTWQEHGGPPIDKPPDRKGFGSLLIEQMLKVELEGDVKLDFTPDGLQAVMDLPVRAMRVPDGARRTSRPRPEEAQPAGDVSSLRGKRILLVEDEYLVANEVCETLRTAGCDVAGPIASVNEALRIAVSENLDGAILDINLAGDRVWPAARALQARRIPFVFATGYSGTIDTPPDLQDARRIEKPATDEALLTTLAASMQPADEG